MLLQLFLLCVLDLVLEDLRVLSVQDGLKPVI